MRWAEEIGGRAALQKRSQANFAEIENWVASAEWIDFLAREPATRSCTSICLRITDPWFAEQDAAYRASVLPAHMGPRVSIEAGVTLGWERWIGDEAGVRGPTISPWGGGQPS